MYNSEKPAPEELPSSSQLLRSTLLAFIVAVAILFTVVLPAEYGIDPTGVGRMLGLAEMGEIKASLAEEAKQDAENHVEPSSSLEALFAFFVSSAQAEDAWKDEISFVLAPGDSAEIKLIMIAGETAEYRWSTAGGRINFDLHAHGEGQSKTYEKGRGKTEGEGSFTAEFKGEHGWFWRNRDKSDVTVNLSIKGDYAELVQK